MKKRNSGNGVKVSKCGRFATVKVGSGKVRVRFEGVDKDGKK